MVLPRLSTPLEVSINKLLVHPWLNLVMWNWILLMEGMVFVQEIRSMKIGLSDLRHLLLLSQYFSHPLKFLFSIKMVNLDGNR
jgi:hypothetical protein